MTPSGTGWPTHPRKKLVEANCEASPGVYIEEVPEITPGFRPGVIVVLQDYQPEMYLLMKKHDGWSNEEYFQFAEKRMYELHNSEPPEKKDMAD